MLTLLGERGFWSLQHVDTFPMALSNDKTIFTADILTCHNVKTTYHLFCSRLSMCDSESQYQDTGTAAADWNVAITTFIIYTHAIFW